MFIDLSGLIIFSISSLVFIASSIYFFLQKKTFLILRILEVILLSPLAFAFILNILDFTTSKLFSLIFIPNGKFYLAAKIIICTIFSIFIFIAGTFMFNKVVKSSKNLSTIFYTIFFIPPAASVNMNAPVTEIASVIVLLILLFVFLRKELLFLCQHDKELEYSHLHLQKSLSLLLIFGGLLGMTYAFPFQSLSTDSELFSNYSWCCVIAVVLSILIFVFYRLNLLAMREKYEAVINAQEMTRINTTFGKVVAPQVRDYLLSNNPDLGGKELIVTVMFCDIRGFTSLSESLDPKDVVQMLNKYFTALETPITENGGIINKYIGDAIMAVFGAPLESKTHAFDALNAAQGMRIELEKLNQEFAKNNLPQVHFGIGLNSGKVLAGNIGTENRLEYTVIGDVVNTASRIESLCKTYKTDLLLSEYTARFLDNSINLEFISESEIRGKEIKVKLFTLGRNCR